jgi:hypothetical protein
MGLGDSRCKRQTVNMKQKMGASPRKQNLCRKGCVDQIISDIDFLVVLNKLIICWLQLCACT